MNSFGVSCFGDAASLVLRLVSVLQRIPKSRHANLAGTGCDRLPPEGSGQVSRCKSCGAGGLLERTESDSGLVLLFFAHGILTKHLDLVAGISSTSSTAAAVVVVGRLL